MSEDLKVRLQSILTLSQQTLKTVTEAREIANRITGKG
jgi:hypothetical protein